MTSLHTEPDKLDRDGFRVKRKTFAVPDTGLSDPITKRKQTVCNLFVNHELSIDDVARVLDEEYGRVVNILIEQGFLHDRRKMPRATTERGKKLRAW
jgi:hypothetical protein